MLKITMDGLCENLKNKENYFICIVGIITSLHNGYKS